MILNLNSQFPFFNIFNVLYKCRSVYIMFACSEEYFILFFPPRVCESMPMTGGCACTRVCLYIMQRPSNFLPVGHAGRLSGGDAAQPAGDNVLRNVTS